MKKIIFAAVAFMAVSFCSAQNTNVNNIVNGANNLVNGAGNLGTPSSDEVIKGLKEALTIGTNTGVGIASKADGFFKNPAIKVPFPPEAKAMETKLRAMGMTKQIDKFVLTLNRAAETASKDAGPIFVAAIAAMTIGDGMNILKGADDAATQYLRSKTKAELKVKFLPIVKAAITKVELLKYWNPLANTYNKMPGVQKVNPDLNDYTTERTLEGLFKLVAVEEGKIRKDPLSRTSDLLKKVFGYK
ncbi:MAG: DUF4197 domain-containing protein [Bacteroidota bacterium]